MLAASRKPLWIAIVDTIRAMGGGFARRRTAYSDVNEEDQLSLDHAARTARAGSTMRSG